MFQFKHGIRKDRMMEALAELALEKSWWQDVLQDKSLLIAVRNDYLNVYWRGQSLFEVRMEGRQILAYTHPKYLLNPNLTGTVRLDPETQVYKADPDHLLMRRYVPGETLPKLKRAAEAFAGEEKSGVQDIVHGNPNVVDVEIAFRDGTNGGTPRIDLAPSTKESLGWNSPSGKRSSSKMGRSSTDRSILSSKSTTLWYPAIIAKFSTVTVQLLKTSWRSPK